MFERIKKWKKRTRYPKNMKSLIAREMQVSRRNIYVGTQHLTPVREKDFHEFLVADMTDKEEYIKGVQECDHFGLYLLAAAKKWFVKKYKKNAAVGMVWRAETAQQRGHAFNFIVSDEYKIRYYEPQLDKEIFPIGRKLFVYI